MSNGVSVASARSISQESFVLCRKFSILKLISTKSSEFHEKADVEVFVIGVKTTNVISTWKSQTEKWRVWWKVWTWSVFRALWYCQQHSTITMIIMEAMITRWEWESLILHNDIYSKVLNFLFRMNAPFMRPRNTPKIVMNSNFLPSLWRKFSTQISWNVARIIIISFMIIAR